MVYGSMKMGKVQEREMVVQFTVIVVVLFMGCLKGTRGGKLISTEPRFRSVKSVAGAKLVSCFATHDLVKH